MVLSSETGLGERDGRLMLFENSLVGGRTGGVALVSGASGTIELFYVFFFWEWHVP